MKEIVFAALVATVAVGGAYAQEQYASIPNSPADHICSGMENPLCGASTYEPYSDIQAPLTIAIQTKRPL